MVSAASISAKVKTALTRVGAIATFTLETEGTYDAETGKVEGTVSTTATATASPPIAYRVAYRSSDSSFKEGVSVVYVAANGLTFVPKVGMRFTLNGKSWQILVVTEHTIQSTVLVYELEVAVG